MNREMQSASTGEIILYNVNEKISLEVHLEQETVWLNQSQMAELFQTSRTMWLSIIFVFIKKENYWNIQLVGLMVKRVPEILVNR